MLQAIRRVAGGTFCMAGILAALGVGIGGCASGPGAGGAARSTPLVDQPASAGPSAGQPVPEAVFQPPPVTKPTVIPPTVAVPEPVVVEPEPIPAPAKIVELEAPKFPTLTPVEAKSPQEIWVPWDAWQQEHLAAGAAFQPGQHFMRWYGVQSYIGFEPHQSKGRLFLNRLDLEKNVLPLTMPTPAWGAGNRTIIIDPGHGGVNGGTQIIRSHLLEKNLTLDWARRLKPMLERRGWQVFMTRTNDIDLPMAERIDFSEASHAALFVSLHFNSGGGNQAATGIETYCLTPVGMASTITREYVDDSGKAYPNNQFDKENLQLAMSVQRSLLKTAGAVDRGVRRARFMDAIRWQARPAILIEGGYLTNPVESERISDPAYRQRLAEGVAKALD